MGYFIRSVGFALQGIFQFFRTERNGRIQGLIAILAIAAGSFAGLERMEWVALLFCIALVISLEMLNSAIEKVCNVYTMDFHPVIKVIKDVAAAAVLWSSIFSMIIGVVIFLPHVAHWMGIDI
jgi:diacylglycerol kinase